MTIEKIDFQITVPVASFQNSKIGATASVGSEEDVMECFMKLKKTLEDMAALAYPHLFTNGKTSLPPTTEEPPIVQIKEPETTEEKILRQIKEIKDKKVLETFKLIVGKKPTLQQAYNERMKSLSTD